MTPDAMQSDSRYLWGIAYRMLGTPQDADEVVQETWARALERRPDPDRPLRPWLSRVATNLALDRLRKRRRRRYVGPWLPAPVDVSDLPDPAPGAEARYSQLESSSFAFLLALEALTPNQRAVLLLREVLDWSTREVATALGLSETNTKVTLHRARRAMAAYDAAPCRPDAALAARTLDALTRFLGALASDDRAALDELLTAEARALSDGGGDFFAARKPIVGKHRVIAVYRKLRALSPDLPRVEVRVLNGLPALVCRYEQPTAGFAGLWVARVEVDAAGRIVAVHSQLRPEKLQGL